VKPAICTVFTFHTKSQPTVPPPGRPRGRSTGVKSTYECSTVGTVSLSRNDVIGV
jgi:hypothetical protein